MRIIGRILYRYVYVVGSYVFHIDIPRNIVNMNRRNSLLRE